MKASYRRKERNERIAIVVLAIALAVAMSILFFGTGSHAEGTGSRSKSYISVQVREASTVTEVAEAYFSSEFKSVDRLASEIKHINNMTGDNLTPGYYIVVPVYSENR